MKIEDEYIALLNIDISKTSSSEWTKLQQTKNTNTINLQNKKEKLKQKRFNQKAKRLQNISDVEQQQQLKQKDSEDQVNGLIIQMEVLKESNEQLKSELLKKKNDFETYVQYGKDIESELLIYKAQVNRMPEDAETIVDLKDEIEKLKEENLKLKSEQHVLKKANEKLFADLACVTQNHKSKDNEVIADLQDEIEKLKEDNSKLNKEQNKYYGQNSENVELHELKIQFEVLKEKNETINNILRKKQIEFDKFICYGKNIESQLIICKTQLDRMPQHIADLQDEIEKLREANLKFQSKAKLIKNNNKELSINMNYLKIALSDMQQYRNWKK